MNARSTKNLLAANLTTTHSCTIYPIEYTVINHGSSLCESEEKAEIVRYDFNIALFPGAGTVRRGAI